MLDLIKKLVSPYKYSVVTNRPNGIFGRKTIQKVRVNVIENDEIFANIYEKLRQEFGDPAFVHAHYGYIFLRDNKYITYGLIEERHAECIITFCFFNDIPNGEKIEYSLYMQIENIVKSAADKKGLIFNKYIHYNDYTWSNDINSQFSYILENENFDVFLTFEKNKLKYSFSKREREKNGFYILTKPLYKGTESLDGSLSCLSEKLNIVIEKLNEFE